MGNLHGLQGGICCSLGNGRGYARHMEPVRPLKYPLPVKATSPAAGNAAFLPVVDHHRGTGAGSVLQKIDSQAALSLLSHSGHVHTVSTQAGKGRPPHRIVRHGGDIGDLTAKVGQGHGNICLATAKGSLQCRGLEEPLLPRRLEPQHNLAKGNYSCHCSRSSSGDEGVP